MYKYITILTSDQFVKLDLIYQYLVALIHQLPSSASARGWNTASRTRTRPRCLGLALLDEAIYEQSDCRVAEVLLGADTMVIFRRRNAQKQRLHHAAFVKIAREDTSSANATPDGPTVLRLRHDSQIYGQKPDGSHC
jgi:hypothetical protein